MSRVRSGTVGFAWARRGSPWLGPMGMDRAVKEDRARDLEFFNRQGFGCGWRRNPVTHCGTLRAEPLLHGCRNHVAGAT